VRHRILLVGPGSISRKYVEVISNLGGMTIVGVVGRRAQMTKDYADEYNIPHYGTNIKDVANRAKPTMALITTPNATHYEGVIESARLGLDVLCEKPLHIQTEKQEKMIRICKENGVKRGVGFSYRLLKVMQYLKNLIESGNLGKILVIDAKLKTWRKKEYYTQSSWHGTYKIDGGGPFMQQGIHIIDLALWFGNGYQEVISAERFNLYHSIEVEDHGYGVVRYGNGAVGMIEASTVTKGYNFNFHEIEITGTRGSITVSFESSPLMTTPLSTKTGKVIIRWNIDGRKKPDIKEEDDIKSTVFKRLLLDFKEAIEQDREPFINGESGKIAVDFVNELYNKSRNVLKVGDDYE
jgi:UDP-N-acetyl-2-amino-2-deoxyglucuronate dehydrogenase